MGGFTTALGNVAGGFEQARQQDLARQFEDEQNRRAQFSAMLQKIALDENAHPYSRTAATQSLIELAQTPYNKKYKLDPNKLVAPSNTQQAASFTPPPEPPMQLGSISLPPAPPQTATLAPTPGIFKTHEQLETEAASGAQRIAGIQAGSQVGNIIYQRQPDGSLTAVPLSHAGTPIGQPVPNAFTPMQYRGLAGMTSPVQYVDPVDGVPRPGLQDKFGVLTGVPGTIVSQTGEVVPNAQVFSSALVPSSTTQSMATSGAVTTTRTPQPGKTTAPAKPSISAPPAPPSAGGVTPHAAVSPVGGGSRAKPPAGGGRAQLPTTPEQLQAIIDPVTREAYDWAMLGQKPTGSVMAVRQVEARMNQLGLAKALPVPPALQRTIQEQFVARNSAIGLIDDVLANKQVLSSMLGAGKIAIASNPDGSGALQRLMPLTDPESKVAGDFLQLIEHANLLRGPLGATGFRGREAWGALQAQRGRPLGDPRITEQTLKGMRDRLVGLNTADKYVLSGQGMTTAAADPYEGRTATGPNGHKIKWTGGKWVDAQTGEPVK